jgi:hypothetical protein
VACCAQRVATASGHSEWAQRVAAESGHREDTETAQRGNTESGQSGASERAVRGPMEGGEGEGSHGAGPAREQPRGHTARLEHERAVRARPHHTVLLGSHGIAYMPTTSGHSEWAQRVCMPTAQPTRQRDTPARSIGTQSTGRFELRWSTEFNRVVFHGCALS